MLDAIERGIHGYYPFGNRYFDRISAADELALMEDLADQFTEGGIDEALPRLTRLAAHFLARPLQQRSGRHLSLPLQHQLQRSTNQAARTLLRRQGRSGIRVFPRLMQHIQRAALRRRLSPDSLLHAVDRFAALTSAHPCLPPLVPATLNPLCRPGATVQHGGPAHNARIQRIVNSMCRQGWCDIRVNRAQVVGRGTTPNRPDVSGINPRTGRRLHVEIDTRFYSSDRHEGTIASRDPSATSTYIVIDPQTGRPREGRTYRPRTGRPRRGRTRRP